MRTMVDTTTTGPQCNQCGNRNEHFWINKRMIIKLAESIAGSGEMDGLLRMYTIHGNIHILNVQKAYKVLSR